jgi:hypothetical protein
MKAVGLKVGAVESWTLATIFMRGNVFRKLLIGRDQI